MTKMKSKKMTKSTFAIIIMAIAMVAMLAFGGTYAYFTATANDVSGTVRTAYLSLTNETETLTKVATTDILPGEYAFGTSTAKEQITLKHQSINKGVTVKFDGFTKLGIWTPARKNAPFICIEPWYGRCDREGFSGDLTEREWGNLLAPGDVWKAAYQVSV